MDSLPPETELPEPEEEEEEEKEEEEEVAARTIGLPPGVTRLPNGQLVRKVPVAVADGESREQTRFVALTLAKAKALRQDFYDLELGWIREGYKLERDRSGEAIMADPSASVPKRPK